MNVKNDDNEEKEIGFTFNDFKKQILIKKEELNALASHISGFNARSTEQKMETLLSRLWEFLPSSTIISFMKDPQSTRIKNLCHEAAVELFRQHPYLSLAPAVTRSLFGYPTKNDRKKKRGTGPQIRNEAKQKGFVPDKELLEQFRVKLENLFLELPVHQSLPKEWTLFHLQLIQKVEMFLALSEVAEAESFTPFIMQAHAFSDHSQESLNCLTTLFTSVGLKIPPAGTVSPITSPDLVFIDDSSDPIVTWYVELKEYHRGTRHSIHATAQLFKYLVENPHVVLVSTQQNFLIQELQHAKTKKTILDIIFKHQQSLSDFMRTLDKSKNETFRVYQAQHDLFSVKEETLFLCLFNDYFLHAQGKIFAQTMALKEIKKLVKELRHEKIDLAVLYSPTKEMIKEKLKDLKKSPLALLVIFEEDLCKLNS